MGLHLPLSTGPGSRRVLPDALAAGLLLCTAACGDDTGDGSIDADRPQVVLDAERECRRRLGA